MNEDGVNEELVEAEEQLAAVQSREEELKNLLDSKATAKLLTENPRDRKSVV